MKKLNGLLSGKKTYVTGIIGLLAAAGAYFTGDASGYQTFQTFVTCLSAIFIRNGIANQ